jgi:hypothetical protein
MASRSGIKHIRDGVWVDAGAIAVDDEALAYALARRTTTRADWALLSELMAIACRQVPFIQEFIEKYWVEDDVERYRLGLEATLSGEAIILSEAEVALYPTFVTKAGLTEDEFRDNFTAIMSTLVGDEDKRDAHQVALADEIRGQRDG